MCNCYEIVKQCNYQKITIEANKLSYKISNKMEQNDFYILVHITSDFI